MTQHIAITVLDKATDTYGRPFFVNHVGQATRSFIDELKNKESALGQHPTDYELFRCGTFDDSTGHFNPETPTRLIRGADFAE